MICRFSNTKVSLDEFAPKTGDNKDVIVLGFYVDDIDPAKDLINFIETGAYETLDCEAHFQTTKGIIWCLLKWIEMIKYLKN